MRATALIAAAGSGQRLGAGGPKAFIELAGRSLLAHSLTAAAAASRIDAVVVAAPPGVGMEPAQRLLAEVTAVDGLEGVVVAGGATRADSVAAALECVEGELVLVHDAARPLAPPKLFDALVERLASDPGLAAAIAATPVADTIKSAAWSGTLGFSETVPRAGLWAAQTPQCFRVAALREAQADASAAGVLAEATDEAWLIERVGGAVLLEPSPATNLKVTTPDDLRIAEALLGASG